MMIFKKAIPRRTLLKGVGATLALPLLDGMVPAFAGPSDTAAKPVVRLGFVFAPNGAIMENWTPATEGAGYKMSPTLEQLAPFRDRLLVLSGLGLPSARALPGESGMEHPRATSTFLTGVHPKKNVQAAVSVDQIAAKECGKHTQLASLELSLGNTEFVGLCDGDYNCSFMRTISWRTPTTPMPMENHPREVFERLFGDLDSTDRAGRLARIRRHRSLLDSVIEGVADLRKGLGPSDSAKLGEYLDAVRDIERRIQLAEEQSARELPTVERPIGIPATFEEHAKLMIDLQVLAYQSDLTRVITFMLGNEGASGGRNYPELGITDLHHSLSHHTNIPEKIAKLVKIDMYHVKMFAYFLEKLRSTPDGDGTLLDHSMIVYSSGLSNANIHSPVDLPLLVAGGGGGKIKSGRHLRVPIEKDTPTANLYLTMLDVAGVPVEKLGDSTGKLDLLSLA